MSLNIEAARGFIDSIDLRGTPRGIVGQDAATEASALFDQAKNQAQVVGSALFSFAQGVDAKIREAVSAAALLAQLHANKQVHFADNPQGWFSTYTEVLQNVGWALKDQGWDEATANGTQVEVNEKIIGLLTVALGAAPTALAIVTAAITALKDMNPDSPWLTLFSREVQVANLARLQIGLVETQKDAQGMQSVTINLVACILSAKTAITQVLFFKWKQANASFKTNTMQVSLDGPSLIDLGPAIRTKVLAYQTDYLSSIKDI